MRDRLVLHLLNLEIDAGHPVQPELVTNARLLAHASKQSRALRGDDLNMGHIYHVLVVSTQPEPIYSS